MRQKIVFVLLICLLGGFGAIFVTRSRAPHTAPAPRDEAVAALPAPSESASAGAGTSAAASAGPVPSGSGSAGAAPVANGSTSAGAPPVETKPQPLLDRPLKVVSLGWELAAPGLLANEGQTPGPKSVFTASGLDVRLSVSDAMSAVEEALARGGSDENGADVAVVPLPTFLAAYERLRALSPEVFFVVGFSRGREAFAAKDGLPTAPVKGDVTLVGTPGAPATFVGLFLLDVAGVPAANVKVVAPGSRDEKEAGFVAFDRTEMGADGAAGRKIVLTTADAPRLVPLVAVAPRGLVADKERALVALAKGFLEGQKKLATDPPGGARIVAAAKGAPEPLALLRRLGDVAPASIGDNARMAGLSGRGALTLTTLFQRTWQLYRGASVLATPPPETPPIATNVIAALARSGALPGGDMKSEAGKGKPSEGEKPLVVFRQEKLDEEALIDTIGLLAAVFERSVVRVSVTSAGGVDGAKTKKVIEAAEGRFDLESGKLVAPKKAGAKGAAVVEVMALP
ncbi:hypothetical protein [Polyangium mundeleinium]|uniref:SsuA/THI5-like domain-containing protein n=1 Tax=Polyangium mundeleinium TaxID=2995306 RepID=A0ABT5F5K8_9BACT|nr:hypothetical protein [Polyangium mundeleinium]MDC0749236.1 hypothetical protein [Polyangium mundeleinium]